MCLYPKFILNRKYTATKKNGGNIPAVLDPRVLYVPIGCGNCIECRKQKAREWQTRLLEDIKTNTNAKFITLTFSNENISNLTLEINKNQRITGYQLDNQIAILAMRRFLERWRKKFKKSLRHWFVTELGHNGTENIHLHGIAWTNDLSTIPDIWHYGYCWIGKKINDKIQNYVNERTIGYICKYVTKRDEKHQTYKSIILTSPGIGNNYTNTSNAKKNKYNNDQTNETYKTRTGHNMSLPIYWRNKIYSDHEKEQLWLQKLNKQERWILGQKISTKNGLEEYFNALKFARLTNSELGYGDNNKDWYKEQYEKHLRELKQLQRLTNNNYKIINNQLNNNNNNNKFKTPNKNKINEHTNVKTHQVHVYNIYFDIIHNKSKKYWKITPAAGG